MSHKIGFFCLFALVFSFGGLKAHHHHHDDNPPCNHESLEDARNHIDD